MRKSITTGLIALFAIVMCAATAQAQNPTSGTVGPLTWKYDTGTKTLTISGQGEITEKAPWYAFKETTTNLVIEEGVTSISGAFQDFTALISVTFPKSLTRIVSLAFDGCNKLPSVKFPDSMEQIGYFAFNECESLTSVELPKNLSLLAGSAFRNCVSLTSVTVPAGVKRIIPSAFVGCKKLSTITVEADNPNYVSEDGLLFNKAKTTLVLYLAGRGGTTFTIPSGTETISNGAFGDCWNLASVTLPSSVKAIGYGAFSGCKNLKSLTVGMNTPPDINKKDVFGGVPVANVTLTVPKGSKAAYETAPVWKEFKQIAESTVANAAVPEARIYAAEGLVYITLPQAATVRIYSLNGVLVRSLTAPAGLTTVALPTGIYIVRTGERTEKVLVD